MIIEKLTLEDLRTYRELDFDGSIHRIRSEAKQDSIDSLTEPDMLKFSWDFFQIDRLVKSLFYIERFEDADDHITPDPNFFYECKGGDEWEAYKDTDFEITFFKEKDTIAFKRIPVILLTKFIDCYNSIYSKDQPMLVALPYVGEFVFLKSDMTSSEFFHAILNAS